MPLTPGHRPLSLLIVVRWSSLSADMQWHWLRASVVVEGRSVTLYEEVHPRRLLANRGVHRRFVQRLAPDPWPYLQQLRRQVSAVFNLPAQAT